MIPNGQTTIGKALRLPLHLVPRSAVVPVLSGANRSCRWIVGSGVNGYWLGHYESRKQHELLGRLKPDSIIYDIGANVGFYTLMFARRCHLVYAFEPLPRNLNYLRRHLELNRIDNVKVMPLALSDSNGVAHFDDSIHPAMGHLAETGIEVETATLDHLLESGRIQQPPDLLKIDIEGAGLFAIQGALTTIKQFKPVVFLALDHNRDYQALEILRGIGYSITEFEPKEIVAV